jgi:hypothetical protein
MLWVVEWCWEILKILRDERGFARNFRISMSWSTIEMTIYSSWSSSPRRDAARRRCFDLHVEHACTSTNPIFGGRSRKRRPLIFAIFADNSSSQLKSSATVTHSLILTNEQRSLRLLIQDIKVFIDFIEYFEFCERFEHLETTILIVTNDLLFIMTLLMIIIRMLLKARFHLFVLFFQLIKTHFL